MKYLIKELGGLVSLTAFCLLFTGCQFIPLASLPGPQIPVYAQNQPVKVMEPITLSIIKCYWQDEYVKPGFENVPPQFQDRQRHIFVAKPKARFLVVEVEAVNTGTHAALWTRIQPPIFALENGAGATYMEESDAITHGSFSGTITGGQGNINPGMSLPGKVIFDVPPGDYTLNFALATRYQAGFTADKFLFKWKLSPEAVK